MVSELRGFRAFRDSQRQLRDARATTNAGPADQLADWSRALLPQAWRDHRGPVTGSHSG